MAEHLVTDHPEGQMSPPEMAEKKMSKEEATHELQTAIEGSAEVLVEANTIVPLFPDTLCVDRAKFTVTHRKFFRTADVMSMRIEDILNVTATVGPFLGNVQIFSRVLSAERPATIGPFWRQDAERIKRITQGYVIALHRGIDCSALSTPELAKLLDELGADQEHVHPAPTA